MVTVNREQLAKVEYLIQQSAQGNHILFDLETVRQVFTTPLQPMSPTEIREIESHIESLITLQDFETQKRYLQSLPEEVLYRVIKMYFNIVENNLFETNRARH
jgi:hypothetical protein